MSGTITQPQQRAGEWQASTVRELRRLNDEYLHRQIAAVRGSANPEERLLAVGGQYAETLDRMIPLPASKTRITQPTSNKRKTPEDVGSSPEELQHLHFFSLSEEAMPTCGFEGVLRVTNADEEKTLPAMYLGHEGEVEEDEEDDDEEDDEYLRGRLHTPCTSVSEYSIRQSTQATPVRCAHHSTCGRSIIARAMHILHIRRAGANNGITNNRSHPSRMQIQLRHLWSR
jgi:hypothetical protein